jgi:hypothetical protein
MASRKPKSSKILKRRQVETTPTSSFGNIKAIRSAEVAAGEIKVKLEDQEGSENTTETEQCIIEATGGLAEKNEVEG